MRDFFTPFSGGQVFTDTGSIRIGRDTPRKASVKESRKCRIFSGYGALYPFPYEKSLVSAVSFRDTALCIPSLAKRAS